MAQIVQELSQVRLPPPILIPINRETHEKTDNVAMQFLNIPRSMPIRCPKVVSRKRIKGDFQEHYSIPMDRIQIESYLTSHPNEGRDSGDSKKYYEKFQASKSAPLTGETSGFSSSPSSPSPVKKFESSSSTTPNGTPPKMTKTLSCPQSELKFSSDISGGSSDEIEIPPRGSQFNDERSFESFSEIREEFLVNNLPITNKKTKVNEKAIFQRESENLNFFHLRIKDKKIGGICLNIIPSEKIAEGHKGSILVIDSFEQYQYPEEYFQIPQAMASGVVEVNRILKCRYLGVWIFDCEYSDSNLNIFSGFDLFDTICITRDGMPGKYIIYSPPSSI